MECPPLQMLALPERNCSTYWTSPWCNAALERLQLATCNAHSLHFRPDGSKGQQGFIHVVQGINVCNIATQSRPVPRGIHPFMPLRSATMHYAAFAAVPNYTPLSLQWITLVEQLARPRQAFISERGREMEPFPGGLPLRGNWAASSKVSKGPQQSCSHRFWERMRAEREREKGGDRTECTECMLVQLWDTVIIQNEGMRWVRNRIFHNIPHIEMWGASWLLKQDCSYPRKIDR